MERHEYDLEDLLTRMRAFNYCFQVRHTFREQPQMLDGFLEIFDELNSRRIDTRGMLQRIINLFRNHLDLIDGFNNFLEDHERMEILQNGEVRLGPHFRRVDEGADRAGRAPLSSDSSPSSSSLQTSDSQPNDSSDGASSN